MGVSQLAVMFEGFNYMVLNVHQGCKKKELVMVL